MLRPEDEKYFNNFFDTFQQDGWKQFIDDAKDTLEHLSAYALIDAASSEQFAQKQGEAKALTRIVHFEQAMRTAYENATDDNI